MSRKIFVNYRRNDERTFAARVRDRLVQTFGEANVFMDVDNLMAGQRFDRELEKALSETDVFLAVIGPRWMDLLQGRQASDGRDFVHEEIAEALKQGITVIPVLVEGAQMPRADALPENIRSLVLHQKQDVEHEQFGQNVAALVDAIKYARRFDANPAPARSKTRSRALLLAGIVAGLAAAYVGAHYAGVPVPWFGKRAAELAHLRATTAKGEEDRKAAQAEAAQLRADDEARRKNDEAARTKAVTEAEDKRKAAEAEQQRIAALQKQNEAAEQARRNRVIETFRDCIVGCPEMVVVPAGSFLMGSSPSEVGQLAKENPGGNAWWQWENPQHKVTIPQAFAIGRFEVTFREWAACVAGGGCASNKRPGDQGWGKGRRPAIDVSWNDAMEYVAWLSRKTGKPYRLLSEAEWEYAARATTTTRYFWGDAISNTQTNFDKKQSVEVGQYGANAWGIHDMHGNVWEWVEDCWHDSYNGAPSDGSAWSIPCTDNRRVLRGGSWVNHPTGLRSAYRSADSASLRIHFIGFRVGRAL
jgi:formylglycine-generating enzyme required for sulfatase activity